MTLMPVLWVALTVAAPAAMAQTLRSDKEASFEDQFWKYLVGNNYKNWSPGPNESAGFYRGENPHGAYLKMYINRTAAGSIDDMAVGSVVILENYLKDQSLKTISVMYRTAGFNPDGNDWYWIEYNPDGSVVRSAAKANGARNQIHNVSLTTSPKRMVMGKASNCIGCHQSAAGEDFVFSNDRIEESSEKVVEIVAEKVVENVPEKVVEEEASGDESDRFGLIADAEADDFFGSR
jgi:hypothetical protein